MTYKPKNYQIPLILFILAIVAFLLIWFSSHTVTQLYALDRETGRVQWSKTFYPALLGNPAASQGRVLVNAGIETRRNVRLVIALDAKIGNQLWQSTVPKYGSGSLMAVPKSVWIESNADETTVIDAATGAVQYTLQQGLYLGGLQPLIVASGEQLALIEYGDNAPWRVQALDASNGALLWQTEPEAPSSAFSPPPRIAANDQRVFVANQELLKAYDAQTGTLQFSISITQAMGMEVADITLRPDILIAGYQRLAAAIDVATGKILWVYTLTPDFMYDGSLQTTEDSVYIPLKNRQMDETWLFALEMQDGSERWRQRIVDQNKGLVPSRLQPTPSAEAVYVIGQIEDQYMLMALAARDGHELWHFALQTGSQRLPLDENLIFISDEASRWQFWAASLGLK